MWIGLSEADRRVGAMWPADCAEHILSTFDSSVPGDDRPNVNFPRHMVPLAGILTP